MNEILKIILSLSLSGSIIAIVIFIFKSFFKNYFSKTWQYYIWLIVIFRMIIPFNIYINFLNNIFHKIEDIEFSEIIVQKEYIVNCN